MELWNEIVAPDELTAYARREQEELYRVDSLATLFPQVTTMGNTVSYTVTENGLVPTAEFRSYDAEASIGGKTQKGRKITLELPPLSQKNRIGELDIMRSRGNLPDEVQRKTIAGTTSDVVGAVEDRMELARGEILETGRLTIEENGLYVDEDLGRDSDMTVAATTPWDDVDAAIIDELLGWIETYSDKGSNGVPEVMVGSLKLRMALQKNLQVLSAISTVNTPVLASAEQLNQVLAAHGLPRFVTYDRKVNVAGVTRRVLSAEKLFFAPAANLGATVWGEAAEAYDPEYALSPGAEGGIVAAAHKTHDPYGFWVRATGVALPILTAPNASMVAGVLTVPEP